MDSSDPIEVEPKDGVEPDNKPANPDPPGPNPIIGGGKGPLNPPTSNG